MLTCILAHYGESTLTLFCYFYSYLILLYSYSYLILLQPEDAERTVSIHTDYIQFLDFDMCPQDKEFLIQVRALL